MTSLHISRILKIVNYNHNLKVATFKDGSTAEVDVIMMCTGYLHSYPFLRLVIIRMMIINHDENGDHCPSL